MNEKNRMPKKEDVREKKEKVSGVQECSAEGNDTANSQNKGTLKRPGHPAEGERSTSTVARPLDPFMKRGGRVSYAVACSPSENGLPKTVPYRNH